MRRMLVLLTMVTLHGANAFQWTQAHPATSPPPMEQPMMAQFGDKVLLFGGSEQLNGATVGQTWLWDGTNWTHVTSFGLFGNLAAPPSRVGAGMAFNPDTGQVVLFGGIDTQSHLLNDTWAFALHTVTLGGFQRTFLEWDQLTTTGVPPARSQTMMEFDPASRAVILTSGATGAQDFADTWAFTSSPPTWTQLSTSLAGVRAQSAMAKCGVRFSCTTVNGRLSCPIVAAPSRILLFGGSNGTILGDQLDFSNGAWHGPLTTQTQPSARFEHAMAYHQDSGLTLLYGGQGSVIQGDTWVAQCFDPSVSSVPTWTQLSLTPNPGLRFMHAMASGPNGSVVLFGGLKLSGTFAVSNETWVFSN